MEDDLPLEYDVIVVGTGMIESITAAALSRIGKRVLHLDSDQYYGGNWASFNFKDFQAALENERNLSNASFNWHIQPEPLKTPVNDDEDVGAEKPENDAVEVDEAPNKEIPKTKTKEKWTRESLFKEYRKFNIDLTPKLLFARGELVELLISSNIARYTEFRCVNRVLTWLDDRLEPVPCSRADVFATKHVSVVEKRMLMKLLTALVDYDPNKPDETLPDAENRTFLEFLKSKKLTSNLIHYVLYTIAGGTDSTSCKEGILQCKKFLNSLGRYGNTPFLWSMYGCGELPQSFCRLCAVFGGIYYLNRVIDKIDIEDGESALPITVHINKKELKCKQIMMGVDKAPVGFLPDLKFSKGISRAVFIIDRSIHSMEKESLTLLRFPPLDGMKYPVTVIELGPSTCACPKDLYVLHMTSVRTVDAKDDLLKYAEKLLSFEDPTHDMDQVVPNGKPKVLWSAYFNMSDSSDEDFAAVSKPGIFVCSGPDVELDFDHAVNQARRIFGEMCPDSEFLPRAPDPEEIVFEGDDNEPTEVTQSTETHAEDSNTDIENATEATYHAEDSNTDIENATEPT